MHHEPAPRLAVQIRALDGSSLDYGPALPSALLRCHIRHRLHVHPVAQSSEWSGCQGHESRSRATYAVHACTPGSDCVHVCSTPVSDCVHMSCCRCGVGVRAVHDVCAVCRSSTRSGAARHRSLSAVTWHGRPPHGQRNSGAAAPLVAAPGLALTSSGHG